MILNLTQHMATAEQAAVGVVEPAGKEHLQFLLTFDHLPSRESIEDRAVSIANWAQSYGVEMAMIGGAPFLMPALERELLKRGITPMYAFTLREVVEARQPNGTVTKTAQFRHVGFVRAV